VIVDRLRGLPWDAVAEKIGVSSKATAITRYKPSLDTWGPGHPDYDETPGFAAADRLGRALYRLEEAWADIDTLTSRRQVALGLRKAAAEIAPQAAASDPAGGDTSRAEMGLRSDYERLRSTDHGTGTVVFVLDSGDGGIWDPADIVKDMQQSYLRSKWFVMNAGTIPTPKDFLGSRETKGLSLDARSDCQWKHTTDEWLEGLSSRVTRLERLAEGEPESLK
uniref:hypothetical protein n=1 Tax=Streptacidiphilus anmyonensis TaxID=405782 RepID=UPI0005A8500C